MLASRYKQCLNRLLEPSRTRSSGLTHVFLGTGAYIVVVSLWRVSEVSTRLLMGLFYERLKASDPPAKVLQVAQNGLWLLGNSEIQEAKNKLRAGVEEFVPDGVEFRDLMGPDVKKLPLKTTDILAFGYVCLCRRD